MDEEFKGDLFKLVCLAEFEKHLKRNKNLYFIFLFLFCFSFPIFMGLVIDAPYLMIIAGNIVISLGTRKFFMNRQENILQDLRNFCKKHNIDITENM